MTRPRTGPRPRKWTVDEVLAVIGMLAERKPWHEIAQAIDRSPASVAWWIDMHLPDYRHRVREEIAAVLRQHPGIHASTLAEQLGVSAHTVHSVRRQIDHGERGRARFASPPEILDRPPGRIVAQRAAQGIKL